MIGERILNYKIESVLGEGGVGKVYLATHTQLGRKVAVKALNPALVNEPRVRERFRNEAATLSSLQHVNIITLYDYFENENGLFLILEYAEGKSLDEYIQRNSGPIPEQKAIFFFNQILDGLAYAHQKGVIHRDIKPSNLIITNDADVKILDFGIAKILKEGRNNLTKTGTQLGTVLYMSPEQVKGQPVDLRTDIYSLGLTLFEMLTGKSPYHDRDYTEFEVYEKILNEPLPSAKSVYPAVSDRMQAVINKATAKNPNDRFQSCEEFRNALNFNTLHTQTGFHTTQSDITQTQTGTNNQVSDKFSRIPEKKRDSFTLLYAVLALVLLVSVWVIYSEISRMSRNNSSLNDSSQEENNRDDNNGQSDEDTFEEDSNENTEDENLEKTPEEIELDSLLQDKSKIQGFIDLLEKERRQELLSGLLVDGQFESADLGEYIIRITVANRRTDARFDGIIVLITYSDKSGKELKVVEKELEILDAGKSITFRERQDISADASFDVKLKTADPIDLEVPPTLDSLKSEMETILEKITELKDVMKVDEEEL